MRVERRGWTWDTYRVSLHRGLVGKCNRPGRIEKTNSGELFTKVLKEQNNMVYVCRGGNPEISNIRKLLPQKGLEGQKRCHLIPGARVPTIKQDSEEGGMPRLGSWRTSQRWRPACRGFSGNALGGEGNEQDWAEGKTGLSTVSRRASGDHQLGGLKLGGPSESNHVGARRLDPFTPTTGQRPLGKGV